MNASPNTPLPDGHQATRLGRNVSYTFSLMPDDILRPASRESALFAIGRALDTRHGHEMAATIAAEVVLATIEKQGMVLMQRPSLPPPGIGPKGRAET